MMDKAIQGQNGQAGQARVLSGAAGSGDSGGAKPSVVPLRLLGGWQRPLQPFPAPLGGCWRGLPEVCGPTCSRRSATSLYPTACTPL